MALARVHRPSRTPPAHRPRSSPALGASVGADPSLSIPSCRAQAVGAADATVVCPAWWLNIFLRRTPLPHHLSGHPPNKGACISMRQAEPPSCGATLLQFRAPLEHEGEVYYSSCTPGLAEGLGFCRAPPPPRLPRGVFGSRPRPPSRSSWIVPSLRPHRDDRDDPRSVGAEVAPWPRPPPGGASSPVCASASPPASSPPLAATPAAPSSGSSLSRWPSPAVPGPTPRPPSPPTLPPGLVRSDRYGEGRGKGTSSLVTEHRRQHITWRMGASVPTAGPLMHRSS